MNDHWDFDYLGCRVDDSRNGLVDLHQFLLHASMTDQSKF